MIVEIVTWFLASLITASFLTKLYHHATKGSFRSDKSMRGKTVLITGANRGLGAAVALDMARRDARVILACRDPQKAVEAVRHIKLDTGNPDVIAVQLDLADFDSVRACAKHVLQHETRLDILVNNAAKHGPNSGQLNAEGIELHYATNHFGPFLLTVSLLPLLLATERARIVNVASFFHYFGRVDLNHVYGRDCPDFTTLYSHTKLAAVLFTRHLATLLRMKGFTAFKGVTANCVNPGTSSTDLARYRSKWLMVPIGLLASKSVQEGTETILHAMLSDDLDKVSGAYLSECGQAFSAPASKNAKTAEWLWEFSEKVTRVRSEDFFKSLK